MSRKRKNWCQNEVYEEKKYLFTYVPALIAGVPRQHRLVLDASRLPERAGDGKVRQVSHADVASTSEHACRDHRMSMYVRISTPSPGRVA